MADSINNTNNVETLVANIKAYGSVIKYGLIALLVGGGWWASRPSTAQPAAPMMGGQQFIGAVPQLQQAVAPAQLQTASFVVMSYGKKKDGTSCYLNSKASFKDPGNQTIELTGAAASTPVESLKNRSVTASGIPGRNGNVVIDNIAALRVQ